MNIDYKELTIHGPTSRNIAGLPTPNFSFQGQATQKSGTETYFQGQVIPRQVPVLSGAVRKYTYHVLLLIILHYI